MAPVETDHINIASKCNSIYEMIQIIVYGILNNSDKGKKLLNLAIEDAFFIIQRYRVSFLEDSNNCNTSDMVLIRSLIKMLSTCAAHDISNQQVRPKTLYTDVFEAKFVQRT